MRRALLATVLWLALPGLVHGAAMSDGTAASDDSTALYRIFLTDGSSTVSAGEFARVGEWVVFSAPLTDPAAASPKVQLISIPADWVDWPRTEGYAASVRYHRYIETRAAADFAALEAQVAALLNRIALARGPEDAQAIADEARRLLIAWPAAHHGYRQEDVRDIVALIDEAVSGVGVRTGTGALQLSLVPDAIELSREPLMPAPDVRETITRLMALARRLDGADRIGVLRAALSALDDPDNAIRGGDASIVRRSIVEQIRAEEAIDARYRRLAERVASDARRASARADVEGVERQLTKLAREDAKLGGRRPRVMQALRADVDEQLELARELRLRRDQWQLRRSLYRAYVERVSAQVTQLVKSRASLDAIRNLSGPPPSRLRRLTSTLAGGAERLAAVRAPDAMREAHELLSTAWQFAEHAAEGRFRAVASGDLDQAWRASSAAAASMMLLGQAQQALREVLEPPQLR
jgi:hypothetical protein